LRGLSSLKLRNTNGKYNKQATERYKLIVSETDWLLWKCRNKRVTCQKEIQPSQIKGRWVAEMNNRIKIEYVKILKAKKRANLIALNLSRKDGWLYSSLVP